MRISASVTATIQQAQNRDRDAIKNSDRNDRNERVRDDSVSEIFGGKSRADRVAQIKEEIKNGTYKLDLFATSDRMARSLLNA
ncbi:flagellar biosynthesis anti-sigma factor FlgM [Helicobacter saguini]|uniref:Flagellar biosynthesis anti-sigma factor FlgM n=1 Tax=Helicobacter saguini TaxID=1548018 RepID=A0A347VQY6_9HELI|nr:flagellar biosynthesis anti-sigma factor FlgM [Helicobacter saguini]MWV63109.1 flagellar biosynthesis anti-sigma factor FlgM [Helicobacter saguini]MWV66221.1 flagellar biosynthesis anti-sigma factor FlgM [Helicobacter saguini]MWV68572.1 flagellar biosynthesis anti-sigma factor FlgM [Helicobacter saguini]MWV71875.1 flagellar biosynthesis anti-sigma factor FlgM [Helicobacter saguini]TLD95890.1 flagellar biosynthesis anti-sigma factor FlgM [Helicobacter saguini]